MKYLLSKLKYPCFLIVLLVLIIGISPELRADKKTINSPDTENTAYGPYCGLRCIYAALKIAQKEVLFKDLLKLEYVGSWKGSSLAELKKSADDHEIYSVPFERLNTYDLRNSPYPVILHVKSAADERNYNHYVLFMGAEKLRTSPETKGRADMSNIPKTHLGCSVPFSK